MLDRKQAEEILRALNSLPADKVSEAQDFITFLRERYGQEHAVDESDVWTEEDLRELSAASFEHLNQLFPE